MVLRALLQYAITHAVAAAVVVAATAVFVAVTFLVLYAWALLTSGPLGSPLAFSCWCLALVLLALLTVVAVLCPVTTLSAALCRRHSRWWQIPTALLLLMVETLTLGALYAYGRHLPLTRGLLDGAIAAALLLLPLGLYWWSLQAVDCIFTATGRAIAGGRGADSRPASRSKCRVSR